MRSSNSILRTLDHDCPASYLFYKNGVQVAKTFLIAAFAELTEHPRNTSVKKRIAGTAATLSADIALRSGLPFSRKLKIAIYKIRIIVLIWPARASRARRERQRTRLCKGSSHARAANATPDNDEGV